MSVYFTGKSIHIPMQGQKQKLWWGGCLTLPGIYKLLTIHLGEASCQMVQDNVSVMTWTSAVKFTNVSSCLWFMSRHAECSLWVEIPLGSSTHCTHLASTWREDTLRPAKFWAQKALIHCVKWPNQGTGDLWLQIIVSFISGNYCSTLK